MFSPSLYQNIYLIVITIITVVVFLFYQSRDNNNELNEASRLPVFAFVLTIVISLFIGYRPVDKTFVDMVTYSDIFYYLKSNRPVFHWNWDELNILYDNLYAWSATYFDTDRPLFVILAFLYFGCIFIACRRMFRGNTLATLLVYLGAFSTFSYGTNGMKAGVAAAIFLVALSFYNKKWIMVLLALVSYGFHHSMQLCIGAMIVAYFYKNAKFYIVVWIVCLFLAIFHVTWFQTLFSGLTDDHGAIYLNQIVEQEEKGWDGFRIDFIIYSFTPIAMGLYTIYGKKLKSAFYNYLLSIYLITNSIWLLCIFSSFTNRIAYLSWLLLPVVLVYPTLHPKWGDSRFRVFAAIMMLHLCFTLFMNFIYYGR